MCNYLMLLAEALKVNELVKTPTWCHTLSSGKVFQLSDFPYAPHCCDEFLMPQQDTHFLLCCRECQASQEQLTTVGCYYC